MDSSTDVTVSKTDAPNVEDRFTVETNVAPESAEPSKVEPEKDKTTKVETPATEPKTEPTEPKPINPRTAQRKAEKERLLRDNATMAERIRQLEQQNAPAQPKVKDPSKEPDIQDYDDVLEYNRDVARFDAAKTIEEHASKLNLQKQTEALAERAEAVRAEKPDFDEKVTTLVQSRLITPDIEKAILASPMGADISYHLAQYGADLMTLRGLPAESLPQAMKAIESFIKNGGEPEKPRVTKAAPPITPPGVSANIEKDYSNYTQEDWEKMPQAEFNKRFMKK